MPKHEEGDTYEEEQDYTQKPIDKRFKYLHGKSVRILSLRFQHNVAVIEHCQYFFVSNTAQFLPKLFTQNPQCNFGTYHLAQAIHQ
jgi:hypothetical protein